MNVEPWRGLLDIAAQAYYLGATEAGRWACAQVLALEDVPDAVRQQARCDQMFFAPLLAEIAPSLRLRAVAFEVPAGWSRFNPSIAAADDGYRLIVRSANYSMDRMRYTIHDVDGVIRTTNYLLSLDDELGLRTVEAIHDGAGHSNRFPGPVRGFEDCRLFRHDGSWFASATTREHDPTALCQIALLRLEGSTFTDVTLLSGPSPGRHEKNWMPLATADGLFFIYSCRPTLVLRYDDATGRLMEIACHDGPILAEPFRGGSQGVELEDGFLFIVHESVTFDDGARAYPHRFLLLDKSFVPRGVSQPFFFVERSVEFCAGLALRRGWLTASFGHDDRAALLASMRLADAIATLRPLPVRPT